LNSSASSSPVASFGPFEVAFDLHELRKRGRRINLQDQPFQVLATLLERPGEVVTREELRQKLWPADTFVDFDHGLNNAINRLREALCDSADKPSFIATVPRRGYRFIASVTVAQTRGSLDEQSSRSAAPVEISTRTTVTAACVPQSARLGEADPVTQVGERQLDSGPRLPNHRLRLQMSKLRHAAFVGVLLIVTGVWWLTWHRVGVRHSAATGERVQSLAVLPLENLSGDTEQEYFADGMTAELITELAKIGSLRVISRTSAMRYKRTRKPMEQIARELNVDVVVEGEVLRSRNRVRVTAQLIQTATDRHLWAEIYEHDLRDVLELQGEVAQSIATAIRAKLTPEQHARLAGNRPVNPEAYDAYLKGRFFWNKRTASGLKKSIEYFQWAIDKDPGYAPAYAGLADSYRLLAGNESFPTREAYSKASAAASKALGLNDTIGEAHTVLADAMYQMNWDWHGAEREFKRAIEVSPGNATAHQRYSLFLIRMGRIGESLAEIDRAQVLDPLSLSINSSVGWRLLWARRFDEAIEKLQKTLEMDPSFGRAHLYLGWAYEAKGNFDKAIIELRKATLSDAGPGQLASLGRAYALVGNAHQAQSILKDLRERSRRSYVPPFDIAIIYAGLGNKDRAFQWLTKGCKSPDVELVSLKADLELDDLRSDPRFEELLSCVGLPQ
jgi:TolB-like protein/DNA-binding winged helix-turn-helix (wHTH) protein